MQQRGRVLHGKPARDVAHGREQRQAAHAIFDGFEGHRRQADAAQTPRQFRQRRQVQVAKQQMVLAQASQVRIDRLLDFDDHLGLREQFVGGGQHRDTDIAKVLVRIAAFLAGAVFDEHFVPGAHQFDAGGRDQTHAPFAWLQFTGNADSHGGTDRPRTWPRRAPFITCAPFDTGQRACRLPGIE